MSAQASVVIIEGVGAARRDLTQQLDDELRPLAIHLIAGFVWTRVRGDRRPRLLFIGEAWSLLRFPEGGAFVAAMARRARKYFLGPVTIIQQLRPRAPNRGTNSAPRPLMCS